MGNPKGFLNSKRETPEIRHPKARVRDYEELDHHLSEDRLQQQSARCMDCGVPFCMAGCPLGNLIPDFNHQVYRGQWEQAVLSLLATNNFPEITGRICPAPCESSCVLGINDQPVSIKQIEKSIAHQAPLWRHLYTTTTSEKRAQKIAIVGSGPCGLSCAEQLNLAGYSVTVFEKHPEPGGLLTWGIPSYKLPKSIVLDRITTMRNSGINFELSTEIGNQISWTELKQGFDAVVLCIGAESPRDLKVPGRDAKGIYFAMEYLPGHPGKVLGYGERGFSAKDLDVVVIGGGDTGADCIGTALREEARCVTNLEIVPRPTPQRATNNPWPQYDRSFRPSSSFEENVTHGGTTEFSRQTVGFSTDDQNNVTGVIAAQVNWVDGQPSTIAGSEQHFPAQLVLLAMGYQGPITNSLTQQLGISVCQRGRLVESPQENIFVAGDCRRGQSLVVWAIAEGRAVANRVDSFLQGAQSKLPSPDLHQYDF